MQIVAAPQFHPRRFGLFSVAEVVTDAEPRWMLGGLDSGGFTFEQVDTSVFPTRVWEACTTRGALTAQIAWDDTGDATLTISDLPLEDASFLVSWEAPNTDSGFALSGTDLDGATHHYDPGAYPGAWVVDTRNRWGIVFPAFTVTDGEAGTVDGTAQILPLVSNSTGRWDDESFRPFDAATTVSCRWPGSGGRAVIEEKLRQAFQLWEQTAVERGFVAQLSAASGNATNDVTGNPSTPAHPVDALAYLEGRSGVAPGQKTILAPIDLVTVWDSFGVLRTVGDHLETLQGNLVAGLDVSAMVNEDDGAHLKARAHVTGPIMLRRGEQIVVGPVAELSPASNDWHAIVVRPYAAAASYGYMAVDVALQRGDYS